MEIQQLHYFLVLCEELNYTRAAKRLYLTRQALCQSIHALEQELGEPLLANTHNHLALTERGQWLRHHAAPVVQSFEQFRQEACATGRPARPLRLGVSCALVPDYLPTLPRRLEEFKTLHENVGLDVSFSPNDAVIAGVESGALELGLIMDLESAAYRLPKTVCKRNQFSLLVAQGHPLWGRDAAAVADLQGCMLALPGQRPESFAALRQACRASGFSLRASKVESYYEVSYLARNQGFTGITRDEDTPQSHFDPVWVLPLNGVPPLCVSLLRSPGGQGLFCDLLWREVLSKL